MVEALRHKNLRRSEMPFIERRQGLIIADANRSRGNELCEEAIELRGRSLEPAGDLLLAHLGAAGPLGERREQGDRYRVQVLP